MDWQSQLLMVSARCYFSRTMKLRQGEYDYPETISADPVPLYIHIPFCESLCPFCSFHRIKLNAELAADYFRALMQEVDRLEKVGFQFHQVYVGGGTPTTMPNELVALLKKICSIWPVDNLTVETNPNHLKDEILLSLRQAGVTRLSVGVQSLNNETLERIGRYKPYGNREVIMQRLAEAQGKFDTFNVDMIFNLPEQSEQEILQDIATLKELAVDQISYYPLMPALANGHKQLQEFTTVSFAREQGLYHRIVAALQPEYKLSSVWCFNKKDQLADEYIIDNDQYLGIGSGAFSLIGHHFYATTFDIRAYVKQIEQVDSPWQAQQRLSDWQLNDYGLLTRLFGLSMPLQQGSSVRPELLLMRMLGAVKSDEQHYRLTAKGRYWWLIMMRELFMGVNRYRRQLRDINEQQSVIITSQE